MSIEVLILSCVTYAKAFWVVEYYKDMPSLKQQYTFSSRKIGKESLAITVNRKLDYFYGFSEEDLRKSYAGGFLYPPVGEFDASAFQPDFPTDFTLKHYYEVSSYAITPNGPVAIDPYQHAVCEQQVGNFWAIPTEAMKETSFPDGLTLSQSL